MEAEGLDPEIDLQVTEKEFHTKSADEEKPHRRLSDTLIDMAEKLGEGARHISDHVNDEAHSIAGAFGKKSK